MCARTPDSSIGLPLDQSSPAAARRFLEAHFCFVHAASAYDDGRLLVSELVTNAVDHGAPPITMALSCAVESVLVTVCDSEQTLPVHQGRATPDAESGRGIDIVDLVSAEWGVRPTDAGKEVWVRLANS